MNKVAPFETPIIIIIIIVIIIIITITIIITIIIIIIIIIIILITITTTITTIIIIIIIISITITIIIIIIITRKSHRRCQWCCLCTEAVSYCDGCVVQQYTKHVLRSMCVLVKVFVAQVLYSSRRNVYIFTNAIKTNSEVCVLANILLRTWRTAVVQTFTNLH